MTPIQFYAQSDLVVIDQNHEMADVDNPRGYVYGFSSYVLAEDERGNRRKIHVRTARFEDEVMPAAESLAKALNTRLAKGKLPVAFGSWEDYRPAYGSEAYIEYGAQDDYEWEIRQEEGYF